MKRQVLLTLVLATAMVGCTHQTVATNPEPEVRNPANTGDIGSVGTKDNGESTTNWYRKELAKTYMQIAARMAQARQKGITCEGDMYHRDVFNAFAEALRYDEKVVVDRDVALQLANTMTYRMYLDDKKNGYGTMQDRLKRLSFDGLVWRAYGQGVYGTTTIYTQKAKGVLEIAHLDIDTLKWNKSYGTWKLGMYPMKRRPNGQYRYEQEVLFFTVGGKTISYEINGSNSGYKLQRSINKGEDTPSDLTDYINDECDA